MVSGAITLIRGTLPYVGQPCQAGGPEDLSHSQGMAQLLSQNSPLKLARLLDGQDHFNSLEISIMPQRAISEGQHGTKHSLGYSHLGD